MADLSRKIGEMEYDALIIGNIPHKQVNSGTIRAAETATIFKRGTILAKSSADNKLVILGTEPAEGETLTPDCILCDDIIVESDTTTAVYTAGCFNRNKVITAEGYTITAEDTDALRKYDIVLQCASTM